MKLLEVSGAVRHIYASLGFKGLNKKIVPRYADIKLLNTSPAARNTQKKVHSRRIRDEIRFMYKKAIELVALNYVNYNINCCV